MAITALSGQRWQGSSVGTKDTADFEETFSSTGHTSDDTTVSGWYANDILRLKYDATNDNGYFNASGAVDILYYDLQHADALNGSNANATNWTLRFKINMTTKSGSHSDGTQFTMGLVSHTANVARDFMGIFLLQAHSSGSFVLNGTINNGYPQNFHGSDKRLGGSSQTLDLASGTDWWVDITRDGDDCITTIYEDEFTGTSYTNTQDVANIADLRYIHFGVYAGNTTFIGTIDDIKFYDGGMTQDDKTTITDVPDGSEFEQTDDYKSYQWKSGALANTTGLRFHYKFDEASGNVINYGSVASANLTVSGLTRDVSTPSGLGNGMSAPSNNSGDYAENTSRVNDYKFMHDGSKWSATFWLNMTATPGSSSWTETMTLGNIWTDDNGIGFCIRLAYGASSTSARIQTFIADGDAGMPLNDQTGNDFVPDLNAWHFYCVTYDPTESSNQLTVTRDASTSGTGYHQGSEDNDTYSSSNPTRRVTYFSRYTPTYDGGMAGKLAQVMIWEDKILTQAEKVAIYASGNGTTALASAWTERGTAI